MLRKMLGWGGGDVNVPCTCTHVACYARCWVGVGGMSRFYISNEKLQVSFIPTRPPTTYVHTSFAHNMIAGDVCSLPAVSTNHIFWYIHMRLHKSYPPLHSPTVVVHWHPWSFCSIPILMTTEWPLERGKINERMHAHDARTFYMRKHNDFSGVGKSDI